jgi:hypothetical protein
VAQVTGGSDYDFVWDEKVEAAMALIREVSDAAAMDRLTDVPEDFVIAALLKTLAYPVKPRIRKVREWEGVARSIVEELKLLRESARLDDCQTMEHELRQILSQAIGSWEEGDPENPRTDAVLNDMVAALFKRKFVYNPPRF